MKTLRTSAALVLAGVAVLSGCAERADTAPAQAAANTVIGGDDRNGQYLPNAWMKNDPALHVNGVQWGSHSDVSSIDPNRVFVVTWGDMDEAGTVVNANAIPGGGPTHMVVVLDAQGNMIENWSQWDTLMHTPHAIKVDPYDPAMPVYVVERGTSGGTKMGLLKFSNDGKQLLWRRGYEYTPPQTIEEAQGRQPEPFQYGQPAVLAFMPNGDVLLGDGYWNCRVVRYNRDGDFVSQFGECGTGDGQFNTVHGLSVDSNQRIYVADRSNDRIQVFEEDGTHVATWPNIASPACVHVDQNDAVWVCGRTTNRLLKYDTEGHLQYHFGTYSMTSGGFDGGNGGFARPHGMDVDRDGNVYVANFDGATITKYTPMPDADPSKLVRPLQKGTATSTN